jgi:hypothetical protein
LSLGIPTPPNSSSVSPFRRVKTQWHLSQQLALQFGHRRDAGDEADNWNLK